MTNFNMSTALSFTGALFLLMSAPLCAGDRMAGMMGGHEMTMGHMWIMTLVWILVVVVLILSAAALIKYLFSKR
jgi:hypothetical protein